ncbi:MAG: ketopantoate reductase family protein [Lacrimispora sp.]|uniref:ketopantoate reductase family protein n=1 Tax=Lacrimispora sp. TaxID=2719234 RepID=UPI0039E722C1
MNKDTKKTVIVGLGALGMLYAGQISRTLGPEAVSFLADKERMERYRKMPFTINGEPCSFLIEDCEEAKPADFVIVAVKYTGLASALKTMKNSVGPDTTIISVMNGIESESIIGERFGHEKVLYCIAQGMDAMKFGPAFTFTHCGELCLGVRMEGQEERLNALAAYLDQAEVPYRIEENIEKRLWGKFMVNVGINQTCMAYETDYAGILAPGEANDTLLGAMREVIDLSQKEGINLSEEDLNYYIDLIKSLPPKSAPSMRQDGIARRHSEVEMFAGTVRRLAAKHGLEVPVNNRLYERIKEMESAY